MSELVSEKREEREGGEERTCKDMREIEKIREGLFQCRNADI